MLKTAVMSCYNLLLFLFIMVAVSFVVLQQSEYVYTQAVQHVLTASQKTFNQNIVTSFKLQQQALQPAYSTVHFILDECEIKCASFKHSLKKALLIIDNSNLNLTPNH